MTRVGRKHKGIGRKHKAATANSKRDRTSKSGVNLYYGNRSGSDKLNGDDDTETTNLGNDTSMLVSAANSYKVYYIMP
jgi:hypothetical protein